MWKAVILATGLYILAIDGALIAYHPLNVPHPLGLCQQERELSEWARERIKATALEDIPTMLQAENLGTIDPRHDWCAPRYHLRKSVPPLEMQPDRPAQMPKFARLPPPRRLP
jgi:hypothetical protein